jgi:hypothetical protein
MIEMIRTVCLAIWKHSRAALAGLIAAGVVTVVANSYLQFREHRRAVVEGQFSDLRSTSNELYQLLDRYAAKARTGNAVDAQTENKFRQTILRAYSQAQAVALNEPRVKDEFSEYAKALIGLKEVAQFNGPLDARAFVEATSQYLDARSKFERKIGELQGSFWRTISGT